jgi:xylan 1,4-beta-xylosidase
VDDNVNNNKKVFQNPILSGFYPDPSICRVGEDYYLVNSSFAYFPGVPIFHSRDLVNWVQIGHILDRSSQLDLTGAEQSAGIFAPTIRYNNGVFYMITTNVTSGGNFIVTATKPEGPWSEPYYLEDAPGIDPSLFFDDDGRAYYVGTRPAPEGERYFGNWEVWMSELDLSTMKLKGEKYSLWRGSMVDVVWPEGPHIYKIGKYYYLMIAEGGTGHNHAITIARSEEITGPYIGNPCNPILTHRHLGKSYPIANVGHGDIVQTQNGEWWMVLLASRPYGGYYRNLGRETFLIPFKWEDEWPLISEGHISDTYEVPNLPKFKTISKLSCDNFDSSILNYSWNFVRVPKEKFYSLIERQGHLRIKLQPQTLTELGDSPALLCRRQEHISFSTSVSMEFTPMNEGECAGIVLYQNHKYNYRFEYALVNEQKVLRLIKCKDGIEEIKSQKLIDSNKIYLKIDAHEQDYDFYFSSDFVNFEILAENIDGSMLSTDVAGGFVGTCIGLYATSNGNISNNHVDFDWFEYKSI